MNNSISLNFEDNSLLPSLFGEEDANIQQIEKALKVEISSRGKYIAITGSDEDIKRASYAMEHLYSQLEGGADHLSTADIKAALKLTENVSSSSEMRAKKNKQGDYALSTRKKKIFAYTDSQQKYLKAMDKKDLVFGIGAAGTGKTYLAVAMAVSMFLEKKVNRIIMSRPAVEAGEKLGYLPGDLKEKLDPYLQPLYDALYEMLPAENIERYFATKEFQIVPLAFMRGRTLSDAFVILDESQNTTVTQMKMFLTRLGNGSKMAITGDLSQIDLPTGTPSGLIDAIEKLKALGEVEVVNFASKDVVRHPLTTKIIEAYEQS